MQCVQRKPTFPLELERVLDMLQKLQKFPEIPVTTRRNAEFSTTIKKSPVFPASNRDKGQLSCFAWNGIATYLSHLERRLVST